MKRGGSVPFDHRPHSSKIKGGGRRSHCRKPPRRDSKKSNGNTHKKDVRNTRISQNTSSGTVDRVGGHVRETKNDERPSWTRTGVRKRQIWQRGDCRKPIETPKQRWARNKRIRLKIPRTICEASQSRGTGDKDRRTQEYCRAGRTGQTDRQFKIGDTG